MTSEEQQQFLAFLIDTARRQGGELRFGDESGATVATLSVHTLAKRPKDMPRALRPKERLSWRQRQAAKREKPSVPSKS